MNAPSASEPPRLALGRVGRAHGLDGSFYLTRAKPRLLSVGATVTLAGRTVTLVRVAGTDAHPIVRVEGVSDRAAAEALRGEELSVDSAQAPALADGEWWAHELEGCAVLDGERVLGEVARLLELPSCEVLEVTPAAGGSPILIPMVKDAIRSVAPDARRIDVDAAFLDLDVGAGGAERTDGDGS